MFFGESARELLKPKAQASLFNDQMQVNSQEGNQTKDHRNFALYSSNQKPGASSIVAPTGRRKSKKKTKKPRSDAIFIGTYAPQDQANAQFNESASCHNFGM